MQPWGAHTHINFNPYWISINRFFNLLKKCDGEALLQEKTTIYQVFPVLYIVLKFLHSQNRDCSVEYQPDAGYIQNEF